MKKKNFTTEELEVVLKKMEAEGLLTTSVDDEGIKYSLTSMGEMLADSIDAIHNTKAPKKDLN